jgi:uncharacterized surface protein with fasciclin (FAS1) repeats
MRKLFTLIFFLISYVSFAQTDIKSCVASKLLIYDANGLVNETPEHQTSLSNGSVGVFSASVKYLQEFEGTFYQAYYGDRKLFFRKSLDGFNWSPSVLITDTTQGIVNHAHPNIYVWRKGGNIHIGITFINFEESNPRLYFIKSNNAGDSFEEPYAISSHDDNFNLINCGLAGVGDTILSTWTRNYAGDRWDQTWFSRSVDGGETWTPMGIAYPGNHYSFVGDCEVTDDGTFYAMIADDQFFRVNLVVRKSTDLGATWTTTSSQVTNQSSGNTNSNAQIRWNNSKLHVTYTHSASFYDQVNYTYSEDEGNTWSSAVDISDVDTLHFSNLGGGTLLYMHTALAFSENNTIYAVWTDSREFNTPIYDSCHFNVYISRSLDNGLTWSENYKVNGPSINSRVFNGYPSVAIKTENGMDKVLVSWSKLRNVASINQTVIDLIEENENLSTLLDAINQAGLGDALEEEGPFTLFAPTNAAFNELPEELLTSLFEDPEGALSEALLGHVIGGTMIPSAMIENGQTYQSLQGNTLNFNITEGNIFINGAQIVVEDILVDNGIVHIIDAVILETEDPTKLESIKESIQLHIYPNPASDVLTITDESNTEFSFSVFSVEGRLIMIGNSNQGNKVQTDSWPQGTYWLRIEKSGSLPFIRAFKVIHQ